MNSTTDLWFAAFLKLKGIELHTFEVLSRGKGKYTFAISNEDWKKMKMDFMRHDISRLKQIMQELKDLLY